MPKIKVVRAFTHTTAEGKLHYTPGEYDVDDAIAEDWYVQAHLEGYQEPVPAPGTMQYAQAVLNAEQAVRRAQPAGPPTQPPAPLPPDVVRVATRSGNVPEGAHYFAGGPQVDKPLPGQEPAPQSQVNFLGTPPPAREA
jgi:hypothetical protein